MRPGQLPAVAGAVLGQRLGPHPRLGQHVGLARVPRVLAVPLVVPARERVELDVREQLVALAPVGGVEDEQEPVVGEPRLVVGVRGDQARQAAAAATIIIIIAGRGLLCVAAAGSGYGVDLGLVRAAGVLLGAVVGYAVILAGVGEEVQVQTVLDVVGVVDRAPGERVVELCGVTGVGGGVWVRKVEREAVEEWQRARALEDGEGRLAGVVFKGDDVGAYDASWPLL